jgi:hypothetical protein
LFSLSAAAQCAPAQPALEPHPTQPGKDVMWIATSEGLTERMLDMARVGDRDFVVDLGSGDGVLVIAAAKRGADALGIEYDAGLVALSRRLAAEAGVAARASFVQADIFETDFSRATVVTMYLPEHLTLRLRPKLLDLKPGTRIVSNTYRLGEWQADDSTTAISFKSLIMPLVEKIRRTLFDLPFEQPKDHCFFYCTAYLWIVPAKVDGRWQTTQGELVLKQSFQTVGGALASARDSTPITNGRLRGDEIIFNVGDAAYSGRVSAGRMEGNVTQRGTTTRWSAKFQG